MKSNLKMALASFAIVTASSSAFAAGSPEAILVKNISCQEGTLNQEAIAAKIAAVGSMTTRAAVEMVVNENSGEKKDKGGAIESSKTIRFMVATSGAAGSFCGNSDKSTYLVVTTSK